MVFLGTRNFRLREVKVLKYALTENTNLLWTTRSTVYRQTPSRKPIPSYRKHTCIIHHILTSSQHNLFILPSPSSYHSSTTTIPSLPLAFPYNNIHTTFPPLSLHPPNPAHPISTTKLPPQSITYLAPTPNFPSPKNYRHCFTTQNAETPHHEFEEVQYHSPR